MLGMEHYFFHYGNCPICWIKRVIPFGLFFMLPDLITNWFRMKEKQ